MSEYTEMEAAIRAVAAQYQRDVLSIAVVMADYQRLTRKPWRACVADAQHAEPVFLRMLVADWVGDIRILYGTKAAEQAVAL